MGLGCQHLTLLAANVYAAVYTFEYLLTYYTSS